MNKNVDLFENKKVSTAVISLVIPTIISQVITVVYNIADTFFIGRLGNPDMVAAASIVLPLFIFLNAISNLFGIGGASLISRALGVKDYDKARYTSAFSIISGLALAILYGLLMFFLRPVILPLIGANSGTFDYCYQYMLFTICIGATPTVFNTMVSHIIRSQGYAKDASFGVTLGGVLNIFLDPLFIFVFKHGIIGAAIATMLANILASIFFIVFIIIKKKENKIILSIRFRDYKVKDNIPKEVILVGLPSAIMSSFAVISNIAMNTIMEDYQNEAVAAIGIAKKIDLLAFSIAMGISQGVLPLIGYNYSSKNFKRMKKAISFTFILSISFEIIATILLFVFAAPIIRLFINDDTTVNFGVTFQKIMCLGGPCIGISLVISTIFQSVGIKIRPLIINLLRKGAVDVPIMHILNHFIGKNGVPLATVIAEIIAMVIAIIMFLFFIKKIKKEELEFNS